MYVHSTGFLGFCVLAFAGGGDKGFPVRKLPIRSQLREAHPGTELRVPLLMDPIESKMLGGENLDVKIGPGANPTLAAAGGERGAAVGTGPSVPGADASMKGKGKMEGGRFARAADARGIPDIFHTGGKLAWFFSQFCSLFPFPGGKHFVIHVAPNPPCLPHRQHSLLFYLFFGGLLRM